MRHKTRIAIVSTAAGFGFAGVLQVAALLATQAGFATLARVTDWPTMVLQAFSTSPAVAIFGGFALGGLAYSIVAYRVLIRMLSPE